MDTDRLRDRLRDLMKTTSNLICHQCCLPFDPDENRHDRYRGDPYAWAPERDRCCLCCWLLGDDSPGPEGRTEFKNFGNN